MCSIHLNDSTAAILRQNTHHTPQLICGEETIDALVASSSLQTPGMMERLWQVQQLVRCISGISEIAGSNSHV